MRGGEGGGIKRRGGGGGLEGVISKFYSVVGILALLHCTAYDQVSCMLQSTLPGRPRPVL